MKGHLLFLGLLLCASAMAADTSVGKPAPEVQARLLDSDATFQLSHKPGKTVIVNFWATWCAPCKAEMPLLQAYLEKHQTEGLEILAISMDDAKDLPTVRRVAQQYPSFQFALKSDATFNGLGRIWRMPTSFVIDGHGTIRKNGQQGEAVLTQAELDAVVTPLLGK